MTSSFVAIDFETANSFRSSACEIGLVRVIDGTIDATYQSLIRPHSEFSDFGFMNVAIHGIQASDVTRAREFNELWPEVSAFIGGLPLVAHNASFDTKVLRDTFELYGIAVPTVDYFCTLVLSRRALNLVSYTLPFVARELGITGSNHHRALDDAKCAAEIALALLASSEHKDLSALALSLRVAPGYFNADSWSGSHHTGRKNAASFSASTIDEIRRGLSLSAPDQDGPLLGMRVAFTGKLASLTRAEAAARVLGAGGEPEANVTKHTDYLVIGAESGYALDPLTATTGKFAKTQAMRAKGSSIEILDELTFVSML
jgi:DNA polymerase III epsilon subunit-like protein